jgi:hypothetical protein
MGMAMLVVALVLASDPASGQGRTLITGTLKSKAGPPLAGIVLFEKGEIHNNVWYRGVVVDASGRFTIEVPDGGPYGLHAYASGYIYAPQAIRAERGKTVDVSAVLVPAPTRANDPVIKRAGFFPWEARQGKLTYVKLDAADPNDDLGPQVMAFDAGTGRVWAMDPPRRVRDLKANFPQGVYQIEVDTSQRPINPRDWYFVVADHQCNTSDILAFPHEPKPARALK